MGRSQPSTPIKEMYAVRYYPDLVLRPFEQVAFEKSLFRAGGGGPVEFGAKQCMRTSYGTSRMTNLFR